MKIERISSQNGSPRCSVCKSHVTPEDIECPICGSALSARPATGKSLPAARPEKPKDPQPKTRKPQTGGFRPFQLPSLSSPSTTPSTSRSSATKPESTQPASANPPLAVSAPHAAKSKPEAIDPAEPSETKTDSTSTGSSNVPPPRPAQSPTRPVRTLPFDDTPKPISRPDAVPIRRATAGRTTTGSAESPKAGGAGDPTSAHRVAGQPGAARPTSPRLKPPPGIALAKSTARPPTARPSARVVIGLIGLLAMVGVGILLVRLGMGMLSGTTASITPTVQVKVVFSGQSITPTLAATPTSAAPALDAPATEVANTNSTTPVIAVTLPAAADALEPTATAAPEIPAPSDTPIPIDTPAPTPTPVPSATAQPSPTPAPTATAILPTTNPMPTKAAASSAFIEYQVQANDTCAQIAERNQISLEAFAATNLLDASNCVLKVGSMVRIPRVPEATATSASMAKATSAPAAFPVQTEYTVQSGDTCGGIAYRFKITAAQLVAANAGLSRTTCFLKVGQKLLIPKSDAVVQVATPTPAPTVGSAQRRSYTVQQGDVCGAIAKRFGVTVNRLAAANNLNPNTCPLKVGRTLVIPEP